MALTESRRRWDDMNLLETGRAYASEVSALFLGLEDPGKSLVYVVFVCPPVSSLQTNDRGVDFWNDEFLAM